MVVNKKILFVLVLVLGVVSAEFGHVTQFRVKTANVLKCPRYIASTVKRIMFQLLSILRPSAISASDFPNVDELYREAFNITYDMFYKPLMFDHFSTANVNEISAAAWLTGIFDIIRVYIRLVFGEFDYGYWELDLHYWVKIITIYNAIVQEKGREYFETNMWCIRPRVGQHFLPLYPGYFACNFTEADPIIRRFYERPIDPVKDSSSLVWKILLLLSILGAIVIVVKLILTEWKTYKSLRLSQLVWSVEIMDKSSCKFENSWKSERSWKSESSWKSGSSLKSESLRGARSFSSEVSNLQYRNELVKTSTPLFDSNDQDSKLSSLS
ncbi:unnamed protein product [Moneuplotes crassus]|uniref:Uncharacterized protein n=1 Tax=Euplotes crassus TaxID=5936 RepID=A0AAD1XM10_EUPCR|nr:unnamed protein product [Moneuplotes crassus]